MNDKHEHNQSGSINPLAQIVINELRKSGCSAWLGCPPLEEIERLKKEKSERDYQIEKRRVENAEQRRAEMTRLAREAIKRSQDEQV